MKTSISDNDNYPTFCEVAATSDLFLNFRNNNTYRDILEHVSFSEGEEYLKIIKEKNPKLLNLIDKYLTNDKIGNPKKFNYSIGNISPTTLRYIKVLSEIIEIYGDLDNKDIVEIGCGYGGQAKIICDTFKIKSYTLIDLDSVLKLTKRYLNSFKLNINFKYLKMSDIQNKNNYDYFISNYAYTECNRDIQMFYYNNILSRSKNGYITANFISDIFNITSLKKDELLKLIPNYKIYEELPKTHKNNIIISW